MAATHDVRFGKVHFWPKACGDAREKAFVGILEGAEPSKARFVHLQRAAALEDGG
jgi:hypothetical protein